MTEQVIVLLDEGYRFILKAVEQDLRMDRSNACVEVRLSAVGPMSAAELVRRLPIGPNVFSGAVGDRKSVV